MLDLALSDGMATRFRVVLDNDGDGEIADLLADERTLLGLSDAGAHASQLCDACFSTHLLGHWVRDRKAIPLEDAVWRLTGHPHRAFRIPERGLVQEGFHADLVAFDPATRRLHPGRAGARSARRRRPPRGPQHRRGAHVGQRRGHPRRRGRTSRASRRAASSAADDAPLGAGSVALGAALGLEAPLHACGEARQEPVDLGGGAPRFDREPIAGARRSPTASDRQGVDRHASDRQGVDRRRADRPVTSGAG